MEVCKHCGREIKYNADLQRYNHVHNNYDACKANLLALTRKDPLFGKRAEP